MYSTNLDNNFFFENYYDKNIGRTAAPMLNIPSLGNDHVHDILDSLRYIPRI